MMRRPFAVTKRERKRERERERKRERERERVNLYRIEIHRVPGQTIKTRILLFHIQVNRKDRYLGGIPGRGFSENLSCLTLEAYCKDSVPEREVTKPFGKFPW